MTCDHKLTNHNVNQFQPITAVHSRITTCEVKGYVTTVGDKLSLLAGFIANLTLTDSVNIDLCGWYSSYITCLFLLWILTRCLKHNVQEKYVIHSCNTKSKDMFWISSGTQTFSNISAGIWNFLIIIS